MCTTPANSSAIISVCSCGYDHQERARFKVPQILPLANDELATVVKKRLDIDVPRNLFLAIDAELHLIHRHMDRLWFSKKDDCVTDRQNPRKSNG